MNCFPWIKLISVLIHLECWYYNTPSLQLPCLLHHLYQISLWSTEISLQRNLHHVRPQFLIFFIPHLTTRHNYWKYQTTCQAKLIKFIIRLYTSHNVLLVKQTTYQKAETLRTVFLSELGNMIHNNSIFNTKCPEFSTKW